MVPSVFAPHAATSRHHITFGDLIFDDDFNVGERASKLVMKRRESCGPAQRFTWIVGQAMGDALGREHFRNDVSATLVPNFFEPAAHQGFVCLVVISGGHEKLLSNGNCYLTSFSSR